MYIFLFSAMFLQVGGSCAPPTPRYFKVRALCVNTLRKGGQKKCIGIYLYFPPSKNLLRHYPNDEKASVPHTSKDYVCRCSQPGSNPWDPNQRRHVVIFVVLGTRTNKMSQPIQK